MTKQEFEYWQAITDGSAHRWVEDSITRLNGNGALYYTGGEDGVYMRLSPVGKLTVGTYEGAFPHIGEAVFSPKMERQYDDINGAFKAACQIGGKQLLDMLSLDAVPQTEVHDDEPGITFGMMM